ncbi:MAG: CocE/NonD family hydrolase [Acidimicrobiales bacterium]
MWGLIVAALLAASLTGAASAAPAEGARGAGGWLAPPEFTAHGGLAQLAVTDADPGDAVMVVRWVVRDGALGGELAGTGTVDEQGALFRELTPGAYAVATGGTIDWVVPVGDPADSTPPQSFYEDQDLVEGFQYVTTRDGTTLSAYVVLPGPIEDGPYPTVVEYSGYNPSDPVSGLGSLAGGLDPTPLCGAFPILCKAPQPSSLLAGLHGYAVVGVNVRGTGCSGGAYDFFETMQVLDGYDVIETVAAQDWVLGNKVGMVGLSYPGISQLFVAKSNPPSLAAITPLSVYGDTATGILAPGGLLNTGFATSWADQVLANAEPYGTGWVRKVIDQGDTECDTNQKLRLQNVDATAKARANPYYTDEIAGPLDVRNWVGDIEAAVLLASAFQDEQTGPSFGDLLGKFDSAESVHQIVYNGLHADGYSPQILSEWAAFLDLYVGRTVPKNRPALRGADPAVHVVGLRGQRGIAAVSLGRRLILRAGARPLGGRGADPGPLRERLRRSPLPAGGGLGRPRRTSGRSGAPTPSGGASSPTAASSTRTPTRRGRAWPSIPTRPWRRPIGGPAAASGRTRR